ncbi:hypothetical protein V8C86DRAFT_3122494 [Haematococcus lacustris]
MPHESRLLSLPDDALTSIAGYLVRYRQGRKFSLVSRKCHEACLASCESLTLNINTKAINAHLSTRIQTALRRRTLPMALRLTQDKQRSAYKNRCMVEGVIAILGYCEAIRSVEFRYVNRQPAASYEHLPVGAWLADRLLSNFPFCETLRFSGFVCDSAELANFLSDSLVVKHIKHLDIQNGGRHCMTFEGGIAWDGYALFLTTLHAFKLGPLPHSLREQPSNLKVVNVTEVQVKDVWKLPQSITELHISDLCVILPELDQPELATGMEAVRDGWFEKLHIGQLQLSFTSLEGAGEASIAALLPLVGCFKKVQVELGVRNANGRLRDEQVALSVAPLLQGCAAVQFIRLSGPLSSRCVQVLSGMAPGLQVGQRFW